MFYSIGGDPIFKCYVPWCIIRTHSPQTCSGLSFHARHELSKFVFNTSTELHQRHDTVPCVRNNKYCIISVLPFDYVPNGPQISVCTVIFASELTKFPVAAFSGFFARMQISHGHFTLSTHRLMFIEKYGFPIIAFMGA